MPSTLSVERLERAAQARHRLAQQVERERPLEQQQHALERVDEPEPDQRADGLERGEQVVLDLVDPRLDLDVEAVVRDRVGVRDRARDAAARPAAERRAATERRAGAERRERVGVALRVLGLALPAAGVGGSGPAARSRSSAARLASVRRCAGRAGSDRSERAAAGLPVRTATPEDRLRRKDGYIGRRGRRPGRRATAKPTATVSPVALRRDHAISLLRRWFAAARGVVSSAASSSGSTRSTWIGPTRPR